jgi:hypothetical protein
VAIAKKKTADVRRATKRPAARSSPSKAQKRK